MPLRYRHIGFSLSVSAQWLSAFLTTFAGPIAIADTSVGWKTWIWFLVFNVIAGPYGKHSSPLTSNTSFIHVALPPYNSPPPLTPLPPSPTDPPPKKSTSAARRPAAARSRRST